MGPKFYVGEINLVKALCSFRKYIFKNRPIYVFMKRYAIDGHFNILNVLVYLIFQNKIIIM